MNILKKLFVVLSLVAGYALTSCGDSNGASCPDGMIECDVNGDIICVPEDIGC